MTSEYPPLDHSLCAADPFWALEKSLDPHAKGKIPYDEIWRRYEGQKQTGQQQVTFSVTGKSRRELSVVLSGEECTIRDAGNPQLLMSAQYEEATHIVSFTFLKKLGTVIQPDLYTREFVLEYLRFAKRKGYPVGAIQDDLYSESGMHDVFDEYKRLRGDDRTKRGQLTAAAKTKLGRIYTLAGFTVSEVPVDNPYQVRIVYTPTVAGTSQP